MKSNPVTLKRQKDFQALMSKGKTYSNSSYLFKVLPNNKIIRYGISPSKKLFKRAVDRNLIKRQIRMIINATEINPPIDLLIIVKQGYIQHSFIQNLQAFQKLYLTIKKGH